MITCIVCGCTNEDPCVDVDAGESCQWVLLSTGPDTWAAEINGAVLHGTLGAEVLPSPAPEHWARMADENPERFNPKRARRTGA